MKRNLFYVLAIVTAFSWACHTQAMNWGLQAGVNMASFKSETGANPDGKTGFIGGLLFESEMAESLYIQPELNLIPISQGPTYLAVPVLFKGKFDAGGAFPFLFAGPELGLKISGTGWQTINFSLTFGGGVEFEVSPGVNAFIDGRYSLGLTKAAKAVPIFTSWKVSGFQILAGVTFPI